VDVALGLVAFWPALALGSFLNVVAARVPLRRSIVHPPSACMVCQTKIRWHDKVPLVSWVLLRARCRDCGAAIPWRYPAVELATALLVAGCVARFGLSARAAVAAVFCAALVAITATDLERLLIPNRIVLPAAAAVLVGMTAVEPSVEWAVASVGASAALLVLALAYPRGLGMGDVKLALLMGAGLGRTVPLAILIGSVTAAAAGIVLVARHGRYAKIPFGPFLALGSLVCLFRGGGLVDAYLGLFR
jgi:leader peptidase (prepilin peptidase)/N-methyltransferase